MESDAEKGRRVLPDYAPGVQDGAAPDALLPGHLHHILGKAGIDDGENHLMLVGCHSEASLPMRLSLKN